MDLTVERLEHLLRVADQRIKHWGDNMLRFDRVNEQEQLCLHGRLGGCGARDAFDCCFIATNHS